MRNIVVGIDIGSHATRVVVAKIGSSPSPQVIGIGKSLSRGMRHGYITDVADVSKSIAEALSRAEQSAHIPIKKARVAIGGISLSSDIVTTSVIISRADGEVTQLDLDKISEQAEQALMKEVKNRHILHSFPIRHRLDGQEILTRPLGMKGSRLEVQMVFITVLEHHYEDILDAVHIAGIEVEEVIASPIAVSQTLLDQRDKVVGSLLVDIGSETVTMSVFENEHLISLEVFSLGSQNITHDIALGLQTSLEEAERIKIDSKNDSSRKKIDEIITARIEDIFTLIEKHLQKIERSGLLPAGIVLTGGGSGLHNIQDIAKKTLRLPARVTRSNDMQRITDRKLADPSWSVAYGLCIVEPLSRSQNFAMMRLVAWLKTIRSITSRFFDQFNP